ncbi:MULTISPECIES: MarR family transcriptional regulator [unclassified Pseudonocardia]|uniref:MarR family winged helix-turn-helix transcriptional regulator n=1 Tax=unclassified Pseudonocardia TaxID=2619320 RepID=UPI0002EAFC4D|nr:MULTISPECIES: MarR family transcriptional regulator [unclassified Pseudonocardia]ALE73372.1 MarR family transcriptional regulator [Pseudonocardia sp. EC080625-04]ALL76713.1 MarR family transcriptional regulator [Pseudonocardia sp. EC080610-09]ALL83741.1 MarR family transcriptional regulator [Pseudonocardia sp. EC080619-01]OLM18896.1 Transcriptional regulator, MarR family [Pseudonocardia sp. Ae707_Ps1]
MTATTPAAPVREDPAVPDRPLTLYLVKRLELAIRARMDEALRPHGLTTLQFTALTALRERDGLSSAQLARRSFVTPQTMNEMVRWLEKHGHVVRRRDPDNRRVLLLTLTTTGRDLLERCDPLVGAIEEEMLGAVPDVQHPLFRQSLELGYTALTDPGEGTPP